MTVITTSGDYCHQYKKIFRIVLDNSNRIFHPNYLDMKSISEKILLVAISTFSMLGYIVSCTRENDMPPPAASTTPVITRGNDVFVAGVPGDGDTTKWKFDKSHSSVLWSTSYVNAAGLLTGRFNQFGVHDLTPAKMIYYPANGQPVKDTSWAFYENDPSKIYFSGYVQINTSNTGEPGRDTACNIGTLGTIKITPNQYNLSDSNVARIKTVKVEFDKTSADYIVTLDFTWRGKLAAPITKQLVGRLKYIKVGNQYNTSGVYVNRVFGLQLKFQFNCKTDFGISSASIADKIDVECNINFNNKK